VFELKRLLLLGSAVLGLLVLAAAVAALQINNFLHTAISIDTDGTDFAIESGMSFRTVSDELAERGIISNSRFFRAYARWTGAAAAIQAGDYRIKQGTTPVELLKQFTSGDVKLYSFTIIEGWNQWDLLNALHDDPNIDASMTDEDWPALLDDLQADRNHPEGLFLPETYRFPRNSTDREVLRQAYELMQKVLVEEWAGRAEDLSITSNHQ